LPHLAIKAIAGFLLPGRRGIESAWIGGHLTHHQAFPASGRLMGNFRRNFFTDSL
jgi:hypothetical protein